MNVQGLVDRQGFLYFILSGPESHDIKSQADGCHAQIQKSIRAVIKERD